LYAQSLLKKPGARKVFLPRLPLPRLFTSGEPLFPSGTMNWPQRAAGERAEVARDRVEHERAVRVEIRAVTGRRVAVRVNARSIVKGWPDWR